MSSRICRLLLPPLIGSLLSIGCHGQSKPVSVPVPVVLRPPPCLAVGDRPPVPPDGAGPSDASWADYYQRLVGWSWRTWRACASEVTP